MLSGAPLQAGAPPMSSGTLPMSSGAPPMSSGAAPMSSAVSGMKPVPGMMTTGRPMMNNSPGMMPVSGAPGMVPTSSLGAPGAIMPPASSMPSSTSSALMMPASSAGVTSVQATTAGMVPNLAGQMTSVAASPVSMQQLRPTGLPGQQQPTSSMMTTTSANFQTRPQMAGQQQGMMNTTGMMQGQQLVRIQGQVTGQQVTLQPGQPVTIQGQQMRMQGPQQQMGQQGHPAILQQHEQIRLQQHIGPGGQMIRGGGQQTVMQGQQQWSVQVQQQQQGQAMMQQQGQQPVMQQQQGWNPQNQQMMQQQGMATRMMGGRPMTPHMHKQQAVIQQHLQQLTPEQRQQFQNMNPREKQQYLAQKGLLLPNPAGGWGQTVQLQRHTIQLTEQQKQMLTNMNPQDRSLFIQKLSKEREAQLRAQMQMQQQNMMMQQQQQQPQGITQQQNIMQQQQNQGITPQQQQTQGMVQTPQQPQPGQQQTPGGVGSPATSQWQQGSPVPSSPQQQPVSPMHPNMSPGNISPAQAGARMVSPVGTAGATGPVPHRPPAWSGETHPALAQVPRTPQQIQHLQRLQIQRQQIGATAGAGAAGGTVPGDSSDPQMSPGQQQVVVGKQQVVVSGGGGMVQPSSEMPGTPQQVNAGGMQQQHIMIGPNGQSQTKVALQNMLSSRLGPTGQPMPAAGGGPTPPAVSMPGQEAASAAAGRIQMINQGPGGMMQSQQHLIQQQQQQQMLAMQQRNNALRNVTNTPPQHAATTMMGGKPVSMAAMGAGPRFGPPGPRQVGPAGGMVGVAGMRPQVPGIPQPRMPQFIGHHMEVRLPPDLCLLGCIFVVADYQESEEHAKYVASWKKAITQYGGEIEATLSPRVTHLLCSSQKSALAQQARLEGKRLITCFWLNDTIKKKKVMPPWKAIHFPLPAQFEPPCANMILTLTGFQERDRDYVKEMIKIVGAKYTSYFSKHNHAIICKAPVGEKYDKAREWKVPVVSVQWLNDVMFGSVNAAQCMSNSKYQGFKSDDPLRMDYNLVPHLIAAWKLPGIRVAPETYQKFKANPPARIKRKAEKQRQEREAEEKRRRLNDERATQGLPPLEPGCFPTLESGDTDLDPVTGLPVPRPPPPATKTSVEPPPDTKEKQDDEKENNPFRKAEGPPKIMFTNMESSVKMQLNQLLTDMCTEYTVNASEVTHLIMTKLSRTKNFFQALPTVKYILTPDWIRKSKQAGKWLPEQDFIIKDKDFEEEHNCNIANLLQNPDRSKVFHGKVFYITPTVQPSMKLLMEVVQAAGGRVENRRLKSPQQIKELNKGGVINYVIITCKEDLHLVTDVLRWKQHIFTPEFVFSALLQCEMDFDISKYVTTINDDTPTS